MRVKGSDIMKVILSAVGIAGILVIAVAAPNLFQVFGGFYKPARGYKDRQLKGSFGYLKRRKFVVVREQGDKSYVQLTELGRKKLHEYRFEDLKLIKQKKWNGKWHMVVFDIPEKYKARRDALSLKLKELGMFRYQKSVWLWPYYCQNEIDFIKEMYEIKPFVKYAVVESVDGERDLVRHFSL